MKKITLASIYSSILLLPVVAFADTPGMPTDVVTSVEILVEKIENLLWIVFGGIAVVMFVVAGILFLTAGGQAEKIQAARSALIWGVAGVVIGILAYSIMAIVLAFLGAS